MDVADRAPRVGQVLLADQHERSLGHAPGVDVAFAGGHLGERADQVHGAGPAGIGLVHGTPPSTAKSTLNAPGPRRKRR